MSASVDSLNESEGGDLVVTVVEGGRRDSRAVIREVWAHRELLYLLARRDVASRYKQSAVGVLWVVLQPLLLATVFTLFIGRLAKVAPGAGVPYGLYAFTGMVMWLFIASAVSNAAMSTVANRNLISKVYFPRLIIPLAAVLPAAFDFAIAFVVALVATVAYGFVPEPQIALMPFTVLFAVAIAIGFGSWLAALNVRYHDVQQAIPFLVLLGLVLTPVIYSADVVPAEFQLLYALNPAVGLLEVYRWMLFPAAEAPGATAAVSLAVTTAAVIFGVRYFLRAERDFADIV